MRNILIVVDMQNDFIDGSLGTKEAQGIVTSVAEKIRNFEGNRRDKSGSSQFLQKEYVWFYGTGTDVERSL